MDTSKIKNVIIILLVCLNLMLLSIVVYDARQTSAVSRAELEATVSILREHGISVAGGVKLDIEAPRGRTVVRDAGIEEENARRVLGRGETENLGGNIAYYTGKNGQASYRGTGEMDVLLEGMAVRTGRDPVKTAVRTMGRLGLSASADSAEAAGEGGSYDVTLACSWDGYVVYNARLSFSFASGRLIMISGTRAFDTQTALSSGALMTYTSAVMRFVEMISEGGFVCSEITGFDAGYIMEVALSGESVLTPVWLIETDTGAYYINAVDGSQEAI